MKLNCSIESTKMNQNKAKIKSIQMLIIKKFYI